MNFDTPEGLLQLGTIMGLLRAKKGDDVGGLLMHMANSQEQIKSRRQQQEMMKLQQEAAQLQLQQQQKAAADQESIRTLAQQSFAPPQQLDPRQQEGGQQMIPGGGGMEQFTQGLMGIDPMQALRMMPKPQGPVALSAGGKLVDPTTGRVVADNPKPQEQWVDAGKDPRTGQMIQKNTVTGQLKAVGSVGPSVTVNNAGENSFNREFGKRRAEQFDSVLNSGMQAQNRLRDIQRFENIVSKVPTGKLEPLKAEVAKLANGLGVKVDTKTLGFQESLEAMANQYALTLRNPGSGAGMPGALSDRDREFLVSMVPGLAKTPEGNKLILEAFRRTAQREVEVAQLARDYKKRKGTFDEGFFDELAQRFGGQDLLGDLYQQASASGAQNVPVGGAVIDFNSLPK